MKFAKSFAIVATVILASASVTTATNVTSISNNTNNNQQQFSQESNALGICRIWRGAGCSSL